MPRPQSSRCEDAADGRSRAIGGRLWKIDCPSTVPFHRPPTSKTSTAKNAKSAKYGGNLGNTLASARAWRLGAEPWSWPSPFAVAVPPVMPSPCLALLALLAVKAVPLPPPRGHGDGRMKCCGGRSPLEALVSAVWRGQRANWCMSPEAPGSSRKPVAGPLPKHPPDDPAEEIGQPLPPPSSVAHLDSRDRCVPHGC